MTNKLHIMQYNARIKELREMGYDIETTMETNKRTKVTYGRFTLKEKSA